MRFSGLPADDQYFSDARKEPQEISLMTRRPFEGALGFVLKGDSDDWKDSSATGEAVGRTNIGYLDEVISELEVVRLLDKVLRKKPSVRIQIDEPGPVDGAVRLEKPKACVCEVIAPEILRVKTIGGEGAVEQKVIVECNQAD